MSYGEAVITITTEGGTTITIPMGSAAVPSQTGSAKQSNIQASKKPAAPTQEPKAPAAPASKKPVARKTASKKRQPKESAKPIYDQIRALTAEGRHDEAIALAESKGWSHVVDSVNAHRAKHAMAAEGSTKVTKKAAPLPKAAKQVVKAAKQPAKIGKPSPKVTKPIAPKPKASAPAKKQPAKQAAPTAPTGTFIAEGDLVDYWSQCIASGNGDIAQAALKGSKVALVGAVKDGNTAEVKRLATRVKTLEHLLAEAGLPPV